MPRGRYSRFRFTSSDYLDTPTVWALSDALGKRFLLRDPLKLKNTLYLFNPS